MSEYLINDTTMSDIADQMRRISGRTNSLNVAEILEIFSRTQGSVKTDGSYNAEVFDIDGSPIKSGMYDTGEVFAMPTAPEIDGMVSQGWACSQHLDDGHYTFVDDSSIMAGALYTPIDDAFVIQVDVDEPNCYFFIYGIIPVDKITIDWGDGTTNTTVSHTYANVGTYTIKIYGQVHCRVLDDDVNDEDWSSTNGWHCNILSNRDGVFTNVKKVNFPSYFSFIKKGFCEGLHIEELTLNNGLEKIGGGAFMNCESLEYVAMPNTIQALGDSLFAECTNLKKVILPHSITEIPKHMFFDCASLQEIIIPDSVSNIGIQAFAMNSDNAVALDTIVLPSVTYIGEGCFLRRKLTNCVLMANEVCSVGSVIFSIYPDNIYVPDELVNSYKAHEGWKRYASCIKPISQYKK